MDKLWGWKAQHREHSQRYIRTLHGDRGKLHLREHSTMYRLVQSLCCTPETKVSVCCQLRFSEKNKNKEDPKQRRFYKIIGMLSTKMSTSQKTKNRRLKTDENQMQNVTLNWILEAKFSFGKTSFVWNTDCLLHKSTALILNFLK